MKIVVFSDAHGHRDMVDRVLAFNPNPDYIICLGDSEMEHDYFLSRRIIHVKGNYSRDPGFSYEQVLEVGVVTLFITHGHKYKVHHSLEYLIEHALNKSYDIVLYGHTHVLHTQKVDSTIFINPGSLSNPRSVYPPSYCILELNGGDCYVTFKNAMTNETIEVEQ